MNWAALFERGAAYETDAESIRESLAAHRGSTDSGEESDGQEESHGE